MKILVCVLSSLCLAAGRPQTSSNYISPAASESSADFYLSPDFTLDQPPSLIPNLTPPEPRGSPSVAVGSSYGSPIDNVISSPSEAIGSSYGSPIDSVISSPSEAIGSSYGSPIDNVISSTSEAIGSSYGSPVDNVISSASEAIGSSYGSPSDNVIALASEPVIVRASSSLPPSAGRERQIKIVRRPVINIVRSEYNAPNAAGAWNYAYEAENGIRAESRGELRSVGEALVNVMTGSYSYVGPDGLTYQVDWYADETGFHPSAPHLPRSVEIPFPEQAAAVNAQLAFAAEQERSAAASNINSVSVEIDPFEYDDLSGYNGDLRAYSL